MNPDRDRLRALVGGNRTPQPLAPSYIVPGRGEHEQFASRAVEYLQLALTCAKNAKAPRTTARIKLAISSAKGAVRAAQYRDARGADEPRPVRRRHRFGANGQKLRGTYQEIR